MAQIRTPRASYEGSSNRKTVWDVRVWGSGWSSFLLYVSAVICVLSISVFVVLHFSTRHKRQIRSSTVNGSFPPSPMSEIRVTPPQFQIRRKLPEFYSNSSELRPNVDGPENSSELPKPKDPENSTELPKPTIGSPSNINGEKSPSVQRQPLMIPRDEEDNSFSPFIPIVDADLYEQEEADDFSSRKNAWPSFLSLLSTTTTREQETTATNEDVEVVGSFSPSSVSEEANEEEEFSLPFYNETQLVHLLSEHGAPGLFLHAPSPHYRREKTCKEIYADYGFHDRSRLSLSGISLLNLQSGLAPDASKKSGRALRVGAHLDYSNPGLLALLRGVYRRICQKDKDAVLSFDLFQRNYYEEVGVSLLLHMALCEVSRDLGRNIPMSLLAGGFSRAIRHPMMDVIWKIIFADRGSDLEYMVDRLGNNLLHMAVISQNPNTVYSVARKILRATHPDRLIACLEGRNLLGQRPLDLVKILPQSLLSGMYSALKEIYRTSILYRSVTKRMDDVALPVPMPTQSVRGVESLFFPSDIGIFGTSAPRCFPGLNRFRKKGR